MEEIEKEVKLIELLGALGRNEWIYSAINDTWYTDFNERLTSGNFAVEVLENLDSELMPNVYGILDTNLPKAQKVKRIFKLLKGQPVSKLEDASIKASQTMPLRPEIKKILPNMYPTRIAIFTRVEQLSADIYTENKICPLYYQNVPDEERGGRIAVVGTLHEEKDGILTGEVLAMPDDADRTILFAIDILAYLGYQDNVKELKKMTNYPCPSNGLVYKF